VSFAGARVTRRFRGAFPAFVLALVAIVPLWAGRYLPAVDYPQHVFAGHALARLIAGDADYGEIYAERRDASAFTFHYFLAGITLVTGDAELATKLHLSILVAMLIAASSMLCTAFGRSPWLAFLSPCFLYGSDVFSWGLFAYLACIPAVLAGTAWLVRVLDDGGRFAIAGLAVATAFIGLGHVIAYIPFFVIVFAIVTTTRSSFLGRAALGMSPAAIFVAGWAARALIHGGRLVADVSGGLPALVYEDPHHATLWSALFGTFKSALGLVTPVVLIVAAVTCVVARAPQLASGPSIVKRGPRQPLFVAGLLAASFYALPYGIEGLLYLVSIRMPLVAAQFFVVSLPFFESREGGLRAFAVRAAIAVALLFSSIANAMLVGDFSREAARIEPIVATVRADGNPCPRIYNMDLTYTSRVAAHAQYLHYAEYVATLTHGVPSSSIVASSGAYPLAYRDDVRPATRKTRPPQPVNEWESWRIDYDSIFAEYDYLLMRDTGAIAAAHAEEYRDRVQLAAASDSWFLFRVHTRRAGPHPPGSPRSPGRSASPVNPRA
jgi:hypothetical protein